MLLHYIRRIPSGLRQRLRDNLDSGGEHVDPNREIGREYHRSPAFLEISGHLVLDVVPAGRSHDHSLEILRKDLVVGPEGIRPGKIYAHALLGQFLVERSDILACTGTLDALFLQRRFHHMAHAAVTRDNDFHH